MVTKPKCRSLTRPPPHPPCRSSHAHAADLEALSDLINSEELDGRDGVPEEHLPTVDDAIAFFTTRGLAHEASIRAQAESGPGGGDAWLKRLYATRDALREVWDAQVEARTPSAAALDTVNALLREAPRVELVPGVGGVGVGHRHTEDDPTGEALARVIEPLVEAIATGETARLPHLRQRRLPLGVRGQVPRRPAPLVRHDLVRQPREGPALSVEAEGGQSRRAGGQWRAGRRADLALLEQRPDLGREAGHRLLVVVRREARR